MIDIVERVKSASEIVEVARERGMDLRERGWRMMATCPYPHEERDGATQWMLGLSAEFQKFCCFGCKRSGDVIDLVAVLDGVTRDKALAALAGRAGIVLPERKA